MTDDETRLTLIRHGQSAGQADSWIAGHSCTGLSALGRRQAEALRERLVASGELADADVLVASAMRRAIETAEIIAPSIGGLAAREVCGVCEWHPGEADGVKIAEIGQRWPGTPSIDVSVVPGAESLRVFQDRVAAALDEIIEEHRGQSIVVACHGGVVRASLVHLLGLPIEGFFDLVAPENTSITEWVQTTRGWRLHRLNDHAHLAALGASSVAAPGRA